MSVAPPLLPRSRNYPIPGIIWSLWLQGWHASPEIVQACRRTWEALNPAWSFRSLDGASLAALLGEETMSRMSARHLPPEAASDIIRIELLRRFGGVWADATTYCLKPLDSWLPDVTGTGFFAFAKPGPDRMISSWFLAASPCNTLVERWAERTEHYWNGRTKRDDYFWFHSLFAAGYACDAEWKSIWNQTPEVLADGPHVYEPGGHEKLWAPVSGRDEQLVEQPTIPMLKLTHKVPSEEYPAQSVIRYLCDRAWERVETGA